MVWCRFASGWWHLLTSPTSRHDAKQFNSATNGILQNSSVWINMWFISWCNQLFMASAILQIWSIKADMFHTSGLLWFLHVGPVEEISKDKTPNSVCISMEVYVECLKESIKLANSQQNSKWPTRTFRLGSVWNQEPVMMSLRWSAFAISQGWGIRGSLLMAPLEQNLPLNMPLIKVALQGAISSY